MTRKNKRLGRRVPPMVLVDLRRFAAAQEVIESLERSCHEVHSCLAMLPGLVVEARNIMVATSEMHAAAQGLVKAMTDERLRRSAGASRANKTWHAAAARQMLDGLPAGSPAGTVPASTVDVNDDGNDIKATDVFYPATIPAGTIYEQASDS